MILFYSEHCPHCRMLLDTIKRHDSKKLVKLASVEALKAYGKLPSMIHSVPALLLRDERKLMFGKSVFDYLLLPGSGFLLKALPKKAYDEGGLQSKQDTENSGEPYAFSLMSGGGCDTFTLYESDAPDDLKDRVSPWSNIEDALVAPEHINTETPNPYQEETRQKISLPDIEYIRQQRDLDLRGGDTVINFTQLPAAAATRVV